MAKPLLSISYLDKDLRRYIAGLLLRLRGFSAPMREIGEALILSTDERFEKEIDPAGLPWEDISPRTRARKRAKGRIDKILQDTGTGRASINYQANRFSVSVGTPLAYMTYHQVGQGQVKREFIGLSEEDNEEIQQIMTDYIRG
jgi:phage virion morphogenesis protein